MTPKPRPRVLLVEDHALVRESLRRLLGDRVDIVGAVGDGRGLLAAVAELDPQVVLMDISMPNLNGLDAAAQLRRAAPEVRVIFVTMHDDPEYVLAALHTGASGYVLKSAASNELLAALDAVLRGTLYVSPQIALPSAPAAAQGPLTPRQREVLQLVAEGRTAREIAEVLTLSRKTVEFHKSSIMRQLGLHNTADLTRYALQHGLIEPA